MPERFRRRDVVSAVIGGVVMEGGNLLFQRKETPVPDEKHVGGFGAMNKTKQ